MTQGNFLELEIPKTLKRELERIQRQLCLKCHSLHYTNEHSSKYQCNQCIELFDCKTEFMHHKLQYHNSRKLRQSEITTPSLQTTHTLTETCEIQPPILTADTLLQILQQMTPGEMLQLSDWIVEET